MDQFQRILHRPGAGIRAEVPAAAVLFHIPGKQQSGKILSHCGFNIGICLIVLEHGIIPGPVLLDQVAFQHQSFQFRICKNVLKPGDMRHHLLNLGRLIPAALEILAHPIFQTDCLSHIDDLIPVIVHQIHSGTGGKLF